jgi:hypothetical protein
MLTRAQARELASALDAELKRFPSPGFALILDEVYLGICHRQFFSILQVHLVVTVFLCLNIQLYTGF